MPSVLRSRMTRRWRASPPTRSRSTALRSMEHGRSIAQEATSGGDAQIYLHFVAHDVYLVMGGTGTVDVSVNGRHLSAMHVGRRPAPLHVVLRRNVEAGQLNLSLAPGVEAYDFTFG